MNLNFDVAVVGSGPAGAYAAYHLAKNGLSVVLIEKEVLPRYKVCGGGLVYRGRQLLDFDIDSIIESQFSKVDIFVEGKDVCFQPEREVPIITMVMRDSFDHHLVKKAEEAGAVIRSGAEVVGISDGKLRLARTDEEINAKFIVLADGALSPVSKLAGFPEDRLMIPAIEYEIEVSDADYERLSATVRFDIDAAPSGYGWCFPKKNLLSIGVGVFKNKAKVKLKDYAEAYIKQLGIEEVRSQAVHGFVIPLGQRSELVRGRSFVAGDAAGFADPIVGEGISNALLSGRLVAEAIAESGLDLGQAKTLYEAKLATRMLPEIGIGLKLAKFFYQNRFIRNLFLEKIGPLAAERLTEVFLGHATYPSNYKEKLQSKIAEKLTW